MENKIEVAPVAERISTISPEECPTCASGVDPTVVSSLFQDALES